MSYGEPEKSPPLILHTAKRLREMADQCELNKDGSFGGAFLIVDPRGNEKDLLLLNNTQDPAMFWGLLKTTADIALAEMQQEEERKRLGSFGGLR